jgi:hypothetical protein
MHRGTNLRAAVKDLHQFSGNSDLDRWPPLSISSPDRSSRAQS